MTFQELTILVVEDNADHALLVRLALRRMFPEIDVRVAGDGRDGVAYLAGTSPFEGRKSHPYPDLVILDENLFEIDRYDIHKLKPSAVMMEGELIHGELPN